MIYGRKCFYCESWLARHEMTVDHFIPNGQNTSLNMVPACHICNQTKADRQPTPAEWSKFRRFNP